MLGVKPPADAGIMRTGVAAVLAFFGLADRASSAYTDAKPLKFRGTFDPFKALDLPRATELPAADVLKKSFKKAALQWHPDRCSRRKDTTPEECENKMEEAKLAQEVLSDDRKLQQWEAWDEDRKSGSRKKAPAPTPGVRQPFSSGNRGGAGGGGRGQTGFGGGGGGFDFGGSAFGGAGPGKGGGFDDMFGGPRQRPRPRPRNRPPPPPAPRPRPRQPQAASDWREVSKEVSHGVGGARVEVVTRERELKDTPMMQVEVVERTCYKAQVQCQEKVVERRRRRREEL